MIVDTSAIVAAALDEPISDSILETPERVTIAFKLWHSWVMARV